MLPKCSVVQIYLSAFAGGVRSQTGTIGGKRSVDVLFLALILANNPECHKPTIELMWCRLVNV